MNAGDRLYRVEREIETISRRQHALKVRRGQLEQERARLRMSLTYDERVRYEALLLGHRLDAEVRA